jgi:DNA-binding CsgD family transcriptional regulator
MKNSSGLATLRALGRAGLAPEAFVPAALEALHAVVPSYRNLFDWTDDAGNIVRYWFEGPIDQRVAAHYFECFYNRREAEVMPAFRHAIRARASVRSAQELDTPAFFRSALYNEVWRPQGLHTRVEALVRTSRGRTLGSLVVYRGPGDARFKPEDERLIEHAAGYIAHGLELGEAVSGAKEFSQTPARRAQVTLDAQGRIARVSADAFKLLMLAHGGVTPDAVMREPRREDYAALDSLWRDARRRSTAIENEWGRFVFDAEPMWPVRAGEEAQLQVAIGQFEQRLVSLRRALDRLPLSAAQREVCALLYRGDSQAQIARQLNVAATTVADHVRKVYAKLDVHSVKELAARISATPASLDS